MAAIQLVRRSLRLGLLATIAALPYLYYLFFLSGVDHTVTGTATPLSLPFGEQLGRIFLIIFICGLIGFSWGRYNGLKGFGSSRQLVRALPWLTLLGVILGGLTLYLGDTYLLPRVPFYYPKSLWFALSVPLYAVFVEEIFTRFGVMTLWVRIFRNIHVANLLSAILFAFLHISLLAAPGLPFRLLNYITVTSFLLHTVASLLLGYTYVYCGLGATMFVQFVVNLRFLALTLVQ